MYYSGKKVKTNNYDIELQKLQVDINVVDDLQAHNTVTLNNYVSLST